jgi:hypothetical protein
VTSRVLAAAAVLALTACASVAPPTPSPSAPIVLPAPGRPYDADQLLAAMNDSRRPGGVPAEIRDAGIAARLAERLWTFDGAPWEAIAAGGSCGPTTCTLELSGGTTAGDGEDVWIFTINPADGTVEVVAADLHAVPDETAAGLDRLARALDVDGVLDGLLPTAVRWLPPPAEDRVRLAYRSGDEEGSCSIDLELDVAAGRIIDVTTSGC